MKRPTSKILMITSRQQARLQGVQYLTVKHSEDNCSQCGLQISSQRQIEHPGCSFCQVCTDQLQDSNQFHKSKRPNQQ
ncbi:hypothetical protein [Endozoicomonas lisbonensis]|uniref:RNA polymerase-binding transcription factor DksA n=1 Tax=Endozoicomonas lisbonensis TaxID=3120522 RepID=A0ABV2SH45_9GAMM